MKTSTNEVRICFPPEIPRENREHVSAAGCAADWIFESKKQQVIVSQTEL